MAVLPFTLLGIPLLLTDYLELKKTGSRSRGESL
jgi:hypothetical protein